MTPGVRVGVDVGSVRVGVAASDPTGLLATPVATLRRDRDGDADLDQLAALVSERAAVAVVVGMPTSLSGRSGRAAAAALDYATRVAAAVPVPVRLVDERFTTVSADAALRAGSPRAGAQERRRSVDAAAAAVLLQSALDFERANGRPAGEPLGLSARGGAP